MDLFKAHNQWSTRPDDERFASIEDAQAACAAYRASAVTSTVPYAALRAEAMDGDLRIVGKTSVPARLSYWAMGQLSQRVGAPAGYLRSLPATLAAQNLNHGLKQRSEDLGDAQLLFHRNGDMLLRAATSERYDRIWNADVFKRLVDMQELGWRTPPARPVSPNAKGARPATEADVLRLRGMSGLSVNVGDMIAPAGIYASDHDMFAFLVNEDRLVDDGRGNQLGRGFFIENSEVGASSFKLTTFLYAYVCGNHIVWGAEKVNEVRVVHLGERQERKAWNRFRIAISQYADESVSDLQAKIRATQSKEIAATKDELLDALLGLTKRHRIGLTKGDAERAIARAEERTDRYGSPRTLWALSNGLSEVSQETPYAAERTKLDRVAGQILDIAF